MNYVRKHFWKEHLGYVRSKFSSVRSSHGLCARAHVQRLEGTLSVTRSPRI